MPRNQKLTKVIAGRTIKAVTVEPGSVLVLFDDQSKMKIKTIGPATISQAYVNFRFMSSLEKSGPQSRI